MQYPQKLVANAWDLSHNTRYIMEDVKTLSAEIDAVDAAHFATAGPVHGFSGTNDNQQTLPLSVSCLYYCISCTRYIAILCSACR
jgi:hypothetical protein